MMDSVHAEYCCKKHGCKYCEDDCPVVLERVQQNHPCEDCKSSNVIDHLLLMVDYHEKCAARIEDVCSNIGSNRVAIDLREFHRESVNILKKVLESCQSG